MPTARVCLSLEMVRFLFAACAISTACTTATNPQPPTSSPRAAEEALWTDPAQHDFSYNPGLLRRIQRSPHGYFRFINRRFSGAVCRRFRDLVTAMPTVNLHGDAHLEQYAVTDRTHGLTDFDDATTGPPVLDLVRLGVSIHLTARAQGWLQHRESFFEALLEGYLQALRHPDLNIPVPSIVKRIRERPQKTDAEFLNWATDLMRPTTRSTAVTRALKPVLTRLHEAAPDLEEDFFEIEAVGGFGLGIGSALREKYLVRVQGPSPAPDDDVILELKQLEDLSEVRCVDGPERLDPIRLLAVRSRFTGASDPFLGHLWLDDEAFWIHGWDASYAELDTEGELGSPSEFSELLYDLGVHLGRGHPEKIASPRDAELRADLIHWTERTRGRLHAEVEQLQGEVHSAWEVFRRRLREVARTRP